MASAHLCACSGAAPGTIVGAGWDNPFRPLCLDEKMQNLKEKKTNITCFHMAYIMTTSWHIFTHYSRLQNLKEKMITTSTSLQSHIA
jgi:hypothetical protein